MTHPPLPRPYVAQHSHACKITETIYYLRGGEGYGGRSHVYMRYPSSSSSYLVYPSSSYPSSLRSPHLNPFSPVFPASLPTSLSPLVIFLTSSLGLGLRGQP
ncbi:hypothetical protein PNOK_0088900 [Pyrrhoderma noxium]|uniref:Uncharacterized protein n=1 Tax=Pyrrhoderma noxium TaxID=2282107 RepID=A0A286UW77_9AGAM|nr:hypothetical protein PNOK_0088900 [Pyrrhoderma noxium]